MGFKFSLKKSSSESDGKSAGGAPQVPRTPLSQANPDWSEKTTSLWAEHTNFLEQTKVSGIAPPVRGGTITGLIAAEKKRSQKSRKWAGYAMVLVIPLTAGGVFFFLNQTQSTDSSSVAPVEPKPVVKNPVKQKPEVKAETKKVEPALPSDVAVVKESPYSLGAADSTYKTPSEKNLKPLMTYSNSLGSDGEPTAVPRTYGVLELHRDEISSLTKWVGKDASAKAMAEQWKKQSKATLGVGIHPVTQFKFDTPENRAASDLARQDLKLMRTKLLSLYAWGEQDVAEQLKQEILAWTQTYRPIGDVYSDAELVTVFDAYGAVWRRFNTDELKATDDWMKLLADREITEAFNRQVRNDRWYAHHLHIVALAGFSVGNAHLQSYVKTNMPIHLASAINSDGTSTTLDQTGSMALHVEHMSELLETTRLLYRASRLTPELAPIVGSNYHKAVAFTAPYALGYKSWIDFEKASDPMIAKRQAAGDVAVAARPYVWRLDSSFLDIVSFFKLDPKISDVAQAYGTPDAHYPTPGSLYYDVMNREMAWLTPPTAPQAQGPRPASTEPQPLPQKKK